MIDLCLLVATGNNFKRIRSDHFKFFGNSSEFVHDPRRCEWFVDRFAVMSFMFRYFFDSDPFMKLRIEPGIKILQLIDNISEGNFTTIVTFNKRRKQLISKMKEIKPLVPGEKERKFWALIRPRESQNLLGVNVTRQQRVLEDKRVKLPQILHFHGTTFCYSFIFNLE